MGRLLGIWVSSRKRSAVGCLALAGLLSAIVGLPHSTAATVSTRPGKAPKGGVSPKLVTVMSLCSTELVRPSTVPLICGTDVAIAEKVVWANWGAAVATGKGTLISSLIAPQPVTIRAEQLTRCADGRQFYARLSFLTKKSLPKGAPSVLTFGTCPTKTTTPTASQVSNPSQPPLVRAEPVGPVSTLPEGDGSISFEKMDAVPLGIAFTSLGDRVAFTKTAGACFMAFIGNDTVAMSSVLPASVLPASVLPARVGSANVGSAIVEELQTTTTKLSTREGARVGVSKPALASAYGSRLAAWAKGVSVRASDGNSTLWFTLKDDTVTAISLRPNTQPPITC